jgi:hypothetical protein
MWAWKFNIHTHEFEAIANSKLADDDYDAIYLVLASNKKLYIACYGGDDIFKITESFSYPIEARFGKNYIASNVGFSSEQFKPFQHTSPNNNIRGKLLVSHPDEHVLFSIIFPMKLPLFISQRRLESPEQGETTM